MIKEEFWTTDKEPNAKQIRDRRARELRKQPHSLVHGYTPEDEAKLRTARAEADKKIDKLNVAFDTFEMDVLTEGADGALKVFIESIKGI